MKFVILITVLALAFSYTANSANAESEIDTESWSKVAEDLAECGGVYSASSVLMEKIGKGYAAKSYEDTARGAWMSGAYLNFISEKMPKMDNAILWAESIKDTTKNYWLGLIELHSLDKENPFPESFEERLSFCVSLNPVQTEIVNQMREVMYSQE